MSLNYFINENNNVDLLIETTLNNTFKLFLNASVKRLKKFLILNFIKFQIILLNFIKFY